MPNMSNQSIEMCHGFGKTPDLKTNYGNAHESDDEIDETYHLKTPPKSYRSAAYCFSGVAFSKLKGIVLSLAWWFYLITCYSLLLDTCVLQGRGITKLRNLRRQQSKNNPYILMLFLFLPLCFCADSPSPMSNPVVESPLSIFDPKTDVSTSTVSPVEVPLLLSEDSSWQDLKYELKITKEANYALKTQVNACDGKITSLASQVELLRLKASGVSKDEVEQMIMLYHADRTGMPDYALETMGGRIRHVLYDVSYASPLIKIFGSTVWSREKSDPRIVIQPGIVPRQCWSFIGFHGSLVIQLSRKIVPTAFTLEHLSQMLLPGGSIGSSTPRDFTVYGYTSDSQIPRLLGVYTYNNLGVPWQTFQVQVPEPGAISFVEVHITSNYGNPEFTCLYRFRVHGHVA